MNGLITFMLTASVLLTSCGLNRENPLEWKSIAFLGDSISYGTNWRGGYGKIIGEENNMSVTNVSKGGAVFASGVTWSQDSDGFRPVIADMTDELDGEYDYIIAEGGVNDFWAHAEIGDMTEDFSDGFDESTMTGGMEKMFYKLKLSFPKSKIGFVIIHDPFTYDAEEGFEPYYERMKEVCDKWSVPYIDLYAENNKEVGVNVCDDEMRKLYFETENAPGGDGCHPNELGYRTIYVEPMIPWLKSL